MKFTLVTSFYNGSKFVNQLYEKINSQTYTNWEWIVTDDFSSDSCKDALIEMSKKDRKVKYVEQSFKKEMFYNPQKFCREAEIIVQVDQDDYPLPKALEVYHHFFTKFPDTVLIASSANLFNETGAWMNFHNPDFADAKNMSCGYLTMLRAWRNNPDVKYDFNPQNWMKYYFNDLSIVCALEETGLVLNLPRCLYTYDYRSDSVSRIFYGDDARKEGDALIEQIHGRRLNKDMDTLNRYFEPIHKECLCLMDHDLNNNNKQVKFAYVDKELNFKKVKLLKDLFFDHDLNVNKVSGDEDCVVFVTRIPEDLDYFFSFNLDSVKKIQFVVWNQAENQYRDEIIQKVTSKYPYYGYQSAYQMIITVYK